MLNRTFALPALLVLMATAQGAEQDYPPRYVTIEQGIEATSSTLQLPDRSPATLYARACDTCPQLGLQITAQTKYLLGRQAVTQDQFNQRIRQASVSLGVFYDSKTLAVNRVVAFGVTATPAK
jgi:hypothetical protein